MEIIAVALTGERGIIIASWCLTIVTFHATHPHVARAARTAINKCKGCLPVKTYQGRHQKR